MGNKGRKETSSRTISSVRDKRIRENRVKDFPRVDRGVFAKRLRMFRITTVINVARAYLRNKHELKPCWARTARWYLLASHPEQAAENPGISIIIVTVKPFAYSPTEISRNPGPLARSSMVLVMVVVERNSEFAFV